MSSAVDKLRVIAEVGKPKLTLDKIIQRIQSQAAKSAEAAGAGGVCCRSCNHAAVSLRSLANDIEAALAGKSGGGNE